MKACLVSELTGFLFILGDNGKVLILDQEVSFGNQQNNQGEFVSTIQSDLVSFTTIGSAHDKILLGTERGTIYVYHMSSLAFISEVPYQLAILSKFSLNNTHSKEQNSMNHIEQEQVGSSFGKSPIKNRYNDLDSENLSNNKFKVGPPIEYIATTSNMRFLLVKYQDSSFVMIDRSANTPQSSILGYQYGHFEQVTGLQWLSQSNKRKKAIHSDMWSIVGSSSDCFITVSKDMSIFVWKHFGDRWQFSYIDTVKCFDSSLSFQRKQSERSTQNLSLTAIAIYPRQPFILVGDNKGVARIFQVNAEQALFIGAYKLQKNQESEQDDAIKEVHITQDESFAVVSFISGLICAYDIRSGFSYLGVIEKDAQRFTYSNQLEVQFKVIEYPSQQDVSFTKDILRNQDERPFLNTTFDSEINVSGKQYSSSQFRVISTCSPNCLKLQAVEVKGHKLIQTPLVQFVIDEGRISGFDIHPSNDYLLITSNKGRIFVYRIDTGELRGTIQIPLHARMCCIDPSGLYVVVSVPPFNQKHTSNIYEFQNADDHLGSLGTNEQEMERTTLLMFEIGTGIAASEIKSVFQVSQMKFSPDGKYLALGSNLGCVCVWALGEHLIQNIKQVLELSVIQPDFWCNYPIFLNDYGVYGTQQTFYSDPLNEQLTPQRLQTEQFNEQNAGQYQNQYSNHQQPYLQQQFIEEPQFYQEPPIQRQKIFHDQQIQTRNPIYRDQNLQITNQSQKQDVLDLQNRVYQPQIAQQRKSPEKGIQVDQNKFYRKTFVEDQQTQVTPNQSFINQNPKQIYQNQRQHQTSNHKSANIQTSNSLGAIAQNQQSFGLAPDIFTLRNQANQQNYQQLSQHSTPNKAELLYRGAYQNTESQKTLSHIGSRGENHFIQDPNLRPVYNQNSPLRRNQNQEVPYVEYVPSNQNIVRESRKDFIDRAPNTQQNINRSVPLDQYSPPKQNLVIDRNDGSQPYTYEENYNAAELYNPFVGGALDNQKLSSTLYDTKKSNNPPISSITMSPQQPSHGGRGRILGSNQKERKVVSDPVDIDDDVSDHGPDSLDHQIQDLDHQNKYLQNIRIPTRMAGDDFIQNYGHKNSEKAYTLERMRQDERNNYEMDSFRRHEEDENLSQSSSTMDIVEQMYDNLDDFERRIQKQKNPTKLMIR